MKSTLQLFSLVGCLLLSSLAHAHVGVVGGPYVAGSTTELVFGVGHGCEGLDTYSLKIMIPSGVGSIRPVPSDAFKTLTIEKDAAETITSVTYTKADGVLFPSDSLY